MANKRDSDISGICSRLFDSWHCKVMIIFCLALKIFFFSGCSVEFLFSRELTGRVESINPFDNGQGNQQPKSNFTFTLTPAKVDPLIKKVASKDDGIISIHVYPMRVSSVKIGDCVKFLCSYNRHFFRSDVILCHIDQAIHCPPELLPSFTSDMGPSSDYNSPFCLDANQNLLCP